MNQRVMVIAFANFTLLVLGVMPIISGLTHGDNIKIVGLANIQFGVAILAVLFIINAYFYLTSGSRVVGKHFSRYWLLYGFFGGLVTTVTVLFSSVHSFGYWELLTTLVATAVGCYCLGVFHTINSAHGKIAQLLLEGANSPEEIARYLECKKLDRS